MQDLYLAIRAAYATVVGLAACPLYMDEVSATQKVPFARMSSDVAGITQVGFAGGAYLDVPGVQFSFFNTSLAGALALCEAWVTFADTWKYTLNGVLDIPLRQGSIKHIYTGLDESNQMVYHAFVVYRFPNTRTLGTN